ncbi:MAG TPA: phosphoglucosamine mutase [Rhodospirillaceae bacterium]|jgi:phosphoglucosamine mutase|nr:phosphoglucosamine mutase [Alphaproteobacteria bacterium]HBH26397.1 phosphoglucosamine mutase [Rhodospirillaceae bacterium]
MVVRRYFGTDGVRGAANAAPMTAPFALRVAMAAAAHFGQAGQSPRSARPRAIIGKDTRLSGYMFEEAMTAGFLAMGLDVLQTGPIPTPAVSMLTRALRAEVGVMISASHNPFQDNGIKLFAPDGRKLPDSDEAAIERLIDDPALDARLAAPEKIGKASRMEGAVGRYVEALKAALPRGRTLAGLRVVVDCAHGAAYRAAPQALWELEAQVIAVNTAPNGRNINAGCGATAPEALAKAVLDARADVGLALDGDADRLIVVDEGGAVIGGDQVLAALALSTGAREVVSTVMAGAGLDAFLRERDVRLHRTSVGDRYVAEAMEATGAPLGGEPSGHIILREHATTGDGLLAGLHTLMLLQDAGAPASEALRFFAPMPQVLESLAASRAALSTPAVQTAIAAAEQALAGQGGRLLVRPSGTESCIRVMAEAPDEKAAQSVVAKLCACIRHSAQGSPR